MNYIFKCEFNIKKTIFLLSSMIVLISCNYISSEFKIPVGYNSPSQKETDSIITNATINFKTFKTFNTFLGFKLNNTESSNLERFKKRENAGKIIISEKIQPFKVHFSDFGGGNR